MRRVALKPEFVYFKDKRKGVYISGRAYETYLSIRAAFWRPKKELLNMGKELNQYFRIPFKSIYR